MAPNAACSGPESFDISAVSRKEVEAEEVQTSVDAKHAVDEQ